jgi:hypothetical protein
VTVRRKLIFRTGRKTVRARVKTRKGRGRQRSFTGWLFGRSRIHKHSGKPGWWLN